jgi:hypothetical protein
MNHNMIPPENPVKDLLLGGTAPARIFQRGMPALEVSPGTELTTHTSTQGQET